MVSRLIKTETDLRLLGRYLAEQKRPFTVEISRKRTTDQNKLGRKWYGEVAEQIDGNTAEEIRGWCKLHIGVPILREENEDFREKYDRIIRPLPYPHKLEMMMEPLDFPVTRLMKTTQKSLYLDKVFQHFTETMGVVLTDPSDRVRSIAA